MDKTSAAIFDLLFKNKIFAKCPQCNRYLCLFECYNAHCPECGNFDKETLLIVDLHNQKNAK